MKHSSQPDTDNALSGSAEVDSLQTLSIHWLAAQAIVGGFLASQIADFNESQDILQEVAADVVKNFAKYDLSKPFVAWAIAIARFKIADFHRANSFDRLVFDEEVIESIAAECEDLGNGSLPIQEALDHCLKRVEGKSRTLLDLRCRDGFSMHRWLVDRLKGSEPLYDGRSLHDAMIYSFAITTLMVILKNRRKLLLIATVV